MTMVKTLNLGAYRDRGAAPLRPVSLVVGHHLGPCKVLQSTRLPPPLLPRLSSPVCSLELLPPCCPSCV